MTPEGRKQMSHTYTANIVHCVFSTKQRAPMIAADRQEHLWAYLLGIARNMKIKILAIGGVADHLHLLIALPPTMNLAKVICDLKANSSRWLNGTGGHFAWQEGYAAFSVSPSRIGDVQLHPQSGRAPQEAKLRRGIRGPASEIGDSLRGEIRARLMSPRWGSMLRARFPSAYALG